MNISNLLFFDKKGESYNLSWNSTGYWEGADYFLPVSTALFDNSNIFILEKVSEGANTSYKFPLMEEGSKFELIWKTAEAKDSLFLFTISVEGEGEDAVRFITKQESLQINYTDFSQESGDLDLSYPLQVNVAFTPTEERAYSRVLQLYYTNDSGTNLVLEMTFYGEGEDEDERLRVWLENFGIKFNREDALLLKDYDLKESLADWTKLNAARKQLLVNQDQVYPYVGTYKGMLNLISLLGYRDVLRVKEYWRDTDPNSAYYKKFAMVDVTDLMQIGDISSINLIDENGGLKSSKKFRKTEFLALAYQFTVASDTYDDDGLPEIVPTTEFSVNEIFFKLHGVAKKLETEILPINVVIRDIIGEFLYFSKFNLRNWIDETQIESVQINDVYKINLLEPNTESLELRILDIKTLYPKLNGVSEFPALTYNDGPIEPYQNGQIYLADQNPVLISAITDYYSDLIEYDFRNGTANPANYGDDVSQKIGCPVVLEAYIPDLTLQDLDGVTFNDFITSSPTTSSTSNNISTGTKTFSFVSVDSFAVGGRVKLYITTDQSQYMEGTVTAIGPGTDVEIEITEAVGTAIANTSWTIYLVDTHYTIATLKYKNGIEIEWLVTGPQEYSFSQRGTLSTFAKIPHILPYTGTYSITSNIYDMQGGVSFDRISLTVKADEPTLQIFTKLQDKFRYDFKNLHNVKLSDLGQTPLFDPYANILNPNGYDANITPILPHYLDWYTYSNYWGVGGRMDEAQIFYQLDGIQPYAFSANPAKKNWGTGSIEGQPTLSDYSTAKLGDLYHLDFSELGYTGDILDGFYLDLKSGNSETPGSYLNSLQFGGFPPLDISISVPSATPITLVSYLNGLDLPGWSNYSYAVLNDRIKATATLPSRTNHSIITALHTVTVYDSGTETSYPADEIGLTISDTAISSSSIYTFSEYYESPTVSETSGLSIGDRVRILNADGGYVDGVILTLTTSNFTVQAQSSNDIGDFTQFDLYWLDRIYTFDRPQRIFNSTTLETVQSCLAQADLTIDENLLFVYTKFDDKLKGLSTYNPAPASSINYWIDLGFVSYDTLPDEFYTGQTQIDFSISESSSNRDLALTGADSSWQHVSNSGETWDLTEDFYIRLDDTSVSWENDTVIKISFDAPVNTAGYTLYIVTDALDAAGNGEYGVEIAALTAANFPKVDGVPSRLGLEITCNDSTSFDFSVTLTGPEQKGYLPSYYDENSFSISNIKTTYDTLIVPINHPIFVTIANIASNVYTEWVLTDINDNIVIQVISPAYFIWRFEKEGSYKLIVKTIDSRNNEFLLEKSISVAGVFTSNQYESYIEHELDARKRILIDT
jgi:hypothetical protein